MNNNNSNPKGPLALLVHPKNRRSNINNTDNLIIQQVPVRATTEEASTSTSTSSTHRMKYFDYDPTGPRLSRVIKKRKRRNQEQMHDAEGQQLSASASYTDQDQDEHQQRLYHPRNGEFTLLFFCEMNCRNSLRVTMVLAKFLHLVEKTKQDGDEYKRRPIQLICIPNDDIDLSKSKGSHAAADVSLSVGAEANIFTHLYSHTEFWHMGFDHVNRSAIIA